MRTAGEILSTLFDKQFAEKALGYSKFFDSWADITEKNGIGSAAAHSRIKDVDKGIVLIEMDHPGWKQILQTKQSKLLNDFRYRFPEMNITAISLMLSRGEQTEEPRAEDPHADRLRGDSQAQKRREREEEEILISQPIEQSNITEKSTKGLDNIKDEDFKEKIKQLGNLIDEKEKERKNVRRN